MEALLIKETALTPRVIFHPEKSRLTIEGKVIPEDVDATFTPIKRWIQSYLKQNESLHLLFRLYYYNTSSARQFFLWFREIDVYAVAGKNISIRWEYEEGDEDSKSDAEEFFNGVGFTFEIASVSK